MVALNGNGQIWVHGGETYNSVVKSTLWSIQVYDNMVDLSDGGSVGGFPANEAGSRLEPLWNVRGNGGIGARRQHCAAAAGDVIFFWGGLAGEMRVVCMCVCMYVCVCLSVCVYMMRMYVCMCV